MEQTRNTYYYQERLREELMRRIDRNPRYSLRSFASALGMNSSNISQILSGKRTVSTKVIDRIFSYLEMGAEDQKKFLESVIQEKKKKGLKRTSPELRQRLESASEVISSKQIRSVGLDQFRVISDWYHYAILEMTAQKNFKSEIKWIAQQLNISITEAKLAVDRLLDLELLESVNGRLKKTNLKLDTLDHSKTSDPHRKRQQQILEKSIHSLNHDPIEDRNHSGLTLSVDPKNIPSAKLKIKNFLWELSKELMSGNPDRAYEMHLSLFPLQSKTVLKKSKE